MSQVRWNSASSSTVMSSDPVSCGGTEEKHHRRHIRKTPVHKNGFRILCSHTGKVECLCMEITELYLDIHAENVVLLDSRLSLASLAHCLDKKNPLTVISFKHSSDWVFFMDLQVTLSVTEELMVLFCLWWQVKVAPLSSWIGLTHTLLRFSLFPSFSWTAAPFLSQASSTPAPLLTTSSQTRDTTLSSSTSMTPSLLTPGSAWICTPWERQRGESWVVETSASGYLNTKKTIKLLLSKGMTLT